MIIFFLFMFIFINTAGAASEDLSQMKDNIQAGQVLHSLPIATLNDQVSVRAADIQLLQYQKNLEELSEFAYLRARNNEVARAFQLQKDREARRERIRKICLAAAGTALCITVMTLIILIVAFPIISGQR